MVAWFTVSGAGVRQVSNGISEKCDKKTVNKQVLSQESMPAVM